MINVAIIIGAIIFGAILIIFGLHLFSSTLSIRLNGIHTKAVVVEIMREEGDYADEGTTYWPVFEYNVVGQVRQAKRRYGSGWTKCYIGQEVEVICHGKEYEKIEMKNDYTMLLMSIICVAMGVMVIGFAMSVMAIGFFS